MYNFGPFESPLRKHKREKILSVESSNLTGCVQNPDQHPGVQPDLPGSCLLCFREARQRSPPRRPVTSPGGGPARERSLPARCRTVCYDSAHCWAGLGPPGPPAHGPTAQENTQSFPSTSAVRLLFYQL
jgi:hypothetical protein